MSKGPLLTDLIPRRNSVYLFVFLGGISLILSLGVLYGLGQKLAPLTTDGKIAAFDLDSEGSIGCWCSIVLLLLCGQATLLIRRFRVAGNCAQRESRAWMAVSAVWFTMSLDEGASLHEGFKEMMARITGTRILGDGSIYWAVPYFLVLSASGLFLLWHCRKNLAAVTCLFSAGVAYALAVAAQIDFILAGMGAFEVWVEESCEMLGDLFILMTLLLHARRLVLQIEMGRRGEGETGREAGETESETPRSIPQPHRNRSRFAWSGHDVDTKSRQGLQ